MRVSAAVVASSLASPEENAVFTICALMSSQKVAMSQWRTNLKSSIQIQHMIQAISPSMRWLPTVPIIRLCLTSDCQVLQQVTLGRRTMEISMRSLMSGMIFSTARYSKADRCCFLTSYSGVPRSRPAVLSTLFSCNGN